MHHPLLSRAAARIRRAAGIDELRDQVQALAAQLGAAPGGPARAPLGPVYLGDHTALVGTAGGLMMLVDTHDNVVAPTLLLHGAWEATVTSWLEQTLRPGQVFVDIGANVGYYTLLAARLVGPAGYVAAAEAHPRLAELLRRNVVLNDLRNVTAVHQAVWSERDELHFHLRTHYAANSSVGTLGAEGLGGLDDTEQDVVVTAGTGDELVGGIPQLHGRRVDAVKVDVEGAELHVFQGLRRTVQDSSDVSILFEWSPGQLQMVGSQPAQLVDLLCGWGLRFRLVENGLAPISPEQLVQVPYGNVVASRR